MAVKQPKLSDKEKEDYKILTNYIQSLYIQQGFDKSDIKWVIMTSQIKNMMSENKGLTYAQIKYILWYMVEILELNLFNEEFNGSILNLVPYYIQEAKEFCLKCKDIRESVKGFDFSDEIRVVRVSGNRDKKVEEMDFSWERWNIWTY